MPVLVISPAKCGVFITKISPRQILDKKLLICYDIQGFSIAHISKHKSHKPCFYKSF